jgi:hypothetical protein
MSYRVSDFPLFIDRKPKCDMTINLPVKNEYKIKINLKENVMMSS